MHDEHAGHYGCEFPACERKTCVPCWRARLAAAAQLLRLFGVVRTQVICVTRLASTESTPPGSRARAHAHPCSPH